MSDQTNYHLNMTGEGFDPEFVMFKLLKNVEQATSHFTSTGSSSGNGYDWHSLEKDMRRFSQTQPEILFEIIEKGSYEDESFEHRHYFKAGLYARIEPVVTVVWPEFAEGLLS